MAIWKANNRQPDCFGWFEFWTSLVFGLGQYFKTFLKHHAYHGDFMVGSLFLNRKPKHLTVLISLNRKFFVSAQQVFEIRQAFQAHPIWKTGKVDLHALYVVNRIVETEMWQIKSLTTGESSHKIHQHKTLLEEKTVNLDPEIQASKIWNPTIWNPETFEMWTFWRSDFKWSSFQMVRL